MEEENKEGNEEESLEKEDTEKDISNDEPMKEEEEENDSEEEEEKNKKKYEKQGSLFLIFLVVIVIAVFVSAWVISESRKYDYLGFEFKKEKFGEIPIHTTLLTGYNIHGGPLNFKLNLRNDPRENTIPADNINLIANRPLYFALNMTTDIHTCGAVPLVSLGQFIDGIGFQLISGVTTIEKAKELSKPYFTCDSVKDSSVIILTEGEESKITQESENCYVISVNNCELTEVIEKFEIATIATFNN